MPQVRFGIQNKRPEPVDAYVEPWPERFRLQPNELLEFFYDAPDRGDYIDIVAHGDGITISCGVGSQPEFLIDGKPANQRSWKP